MLMLSLVTASASARVQQDDVQIQDPIGDANYINDGGRSGLNGTPFVGNVVTDPDLDDKSDLVAAWFSNDVNTISVHIRTEALAGYEDETRIYYVRSNPGAPFPYASDCLMWLIVVGSEGGHLNTNYARVSDYCVKKDNLGPLIDLKIESLSDGSGIVTASAPRDYSPLFDRGRTIVAPWAYSKIADGSSTAIDTTTRGDDYTIRG